MRVLVVIRQSRAKELSESPETQRQAIQQWAEREGHTLAAEAADIGVSAEVSPFNRKRLGPWLNEPEKLAQWDILAVWKVDRVVRDMTHFYGDLMPELRPLGKSVVAVTENVNTLTTSPMELAMRVSMAEEELRTIRDRASGSRIALRANARWPGGTPPFGYYTEKTPEGVKLRVDHEAKAVLHTLYGMILDGHSLNGCVRWLGEQGTLTATDRNRQRLGKPVKDTGWRWGTLRKTLRSRHLLGQMTYDGEVIRDDDGEPRQFGEPLLSRDEYNELQAALNRPKREKRRLNGSLLRGVAFCGYCGRQMYRRPVSQGYSGRDVYYCSSRDEPRQKSGKVDRDCREVGYPCELLDELVTESFLDEYGNREVVEVSASAVVDHSARLGEIAEAMGQLETDRYIKGRFSGDDGERRFDRIYAQLEAERDEKRQEQQAAGVNRTGTGETYRDLWERLDRDEQGDMLRRFGVFVMAQRQRADWDIPLAISDHFHLYFPRMDD